MANGLSQAMINAAIAANRTPDEFKVPAKMYFHAHNGARFHIQYTDNHGNPVPGNVKTLTFGNSRYMTDDAREQKQLDMVADVPGTFIYTLPDNEAAKILEDEIAMETRKQIEAAARAASAMAGRQYNPNDPIVPVSLEPGHAPAGLQVRPIAPAHTGMQNSFSGTAATEQPQQAVATQAADQVQIPGGGVTAANAAMLAKINELSSKPAATA